MRNFSILPPSLVRFVDDTGLEQAADSHALQTDMPPVKVDKEPVLHYARSSGAQINPLLVQATKQWMEAGEKYSNPALNDKIRSLFTASGMVESAASIAGIMSVCYWAYTKFQRFQEHPEEFKKQFDMATLGPQLPVMAGAVSGIYPLIARAINKAQAAVVKSEVEVLTHIFNEFLDGEDAFLADHSIPKDNRDTLRSLAGAFFRARRENAPEKMKSYLERYIWGRAIPMEKKELAYMDEGHDQTIRKRLDENVGLLVSSEPEENQEALQSYIDLIRAGENLILWMYGPPGVGKTRFGHEIAEALENSHLIVRLGDTANGADLDEALGERAGSGRLSGPDYYSERSLDEVMSPFNRKLAQTGYTNAFAQIDEMGDDMTDSKNSTRLLKQIKLRHEQKMRPIAGMECEMPSELNFIVTSNRRITLDMVPESERKSLAAFFHRIKYVEKKALSFEVKRTIALQCWDIILKKLKNKHNDYRPIEQMRDLIIDKCLEQNEKQGIPGAHVIIKCIKAVVIDIFNKKYRKVYDKDSPGHPINEDDIQFAVEKRFIESDMEYLAKLEAETEAAAVKTETEAAELVTPKTMDVGTMTIE